MRANVRLLSGSEGIGYFQVDVGWRWFAAKVGFRRDPSSGCLRLTCHDREKRDILTTADVVFPVFPVFSGF